MNEILRTILVNRRGIFSHVPESAVHFKMTEIVPTGMGL